MGYPGSPGTQKHRPQSAGTLGKHSCTGLICCSSLPHEGGAAASIPELFTCWLSLEATCLFHPVLPW